MELVFMGKSGSRSADTAALDILTQKQLAWQHEQEVRVFERSGTSVTKQSGDIGNKLDPMKTLH